MRPYPEMTFRGPAVLDDHGIRPGSGCREGKEDEDEDEWGENSLRRAREGGIGYAESRSGRVV